MTLLVIFHTSSRYLPKHFNGEGPGDEEGEEQSVSSVYFQWYLHGSEPLIQPLHDCNWLITKQGLGQLLLVLVWDKCMFCSSFWESSFFEQRLWGSFGLEIDTSPRNSSGAKHNVLSTKIYQTKHHRIWVLLKAVATLPKSFIPKKQLSLLNSSTSGLVGGDLLSEWQVLAGSLW